MKDSRRVVLGSSELGTSLSTRDQTAYTFHIWQHAALPCRQACIDRIAGNSKGLLLILSHGTSRHTHCYADQKCNPESRKIAMEAATGRAEDPDPSGKRHDEVGVEWGITASGWGREEGGLRRVAVTPSIRIRNYGEYGIRTHSQQLRWCPDNVSSLRPSLLRAPCLLLLVCIQQTPSTLPRTFRPVHAWPMCAAGAVHCN